MVSAFEEQNRCRITLTFRVQQGLGGPYLIAEAKAVEAGSATAEHALLGLVSASSAQQNFRTLSALATYLLYQLDFAMAEIEWESTKKPDA